MDIRSSRLKSGTWWVVLLLVVVSIHLACKGPRPLAADASDSVGVHDFDVVSTDVVGATGVASTDFNDAIGVKPSAHLVSSVEEAPESLIDLARRDPQALVRRALHHCETQIHDYRGVLIKQERAGGTLGAPQTIVIAIQEQPRRVLMTWIRNPDRIRKALYVEGRHWDGRGRELVEVEPAGAIARALLGSVLTAAHDPDREADGLGSIDQLGFQSMLRSMVRINNRAEQLGLLRFSFVGEGSIDGRPTFKLIREIRDAASVGKRAAARLVLHLDQDWLAPVSIECYDDCAGQHLVRSYVFSRVAINPGLSGSSFTLDGDSANASAR